MDDKYTGWNINTGRAYEGLVRAKRKGTEVPNLSIWLQSRYGRKLESGHTSYDLLCRLSPTCRMITCEYLSRYRSIRTSYQIDSSLLLSYQFFQRLRTVSLLERTIGGIGYRLPNSPAWVIQPSLNQSSSPPLPWACLQKASETDHEVSW